MRHYLLPAFFLLIASCGLSCAQDSPATPSVLSSQIDVTVAEFEGRYKVGETSCVITPIKMAFELQWAKGKGVMLFFFDKTLPDGKVIFATEPLGKSKGKDKFIFDNDRYESGIFVRADGKIFVVERVNYQPLNR